MTNIIFMGERNHESNQLSAYRRHQEGTNTPQKQKPICKEQVHIRLNHKLLAIQEWLSAKEQLE
jgi:hypothetical protein